MQLRSLALTFCLIASTSALGDVIVDQQHTFTSSIASSTNGDVSQMGQTFTVGVNGTLDHIDVFMFRLGGFFDPTGDPVLRLYNTAGGLPSGSAIFTTTVSELDVPLNSAAMVTFDVSLAELFVTAGEVYAFSVTAAAGTGPYFLPTDQDQPIEYVGGAAIAKFGANPWQLISPAQDHSFRTFVDAVPEPSSCLALLLASVVSLGLRRRPRHS